MHTDRTGLPHRHAARPPSDSALNPDLVPSARVVGFGAPLSVRITLAACEVPALRVQVQDQLDRVRGDRPPAGPCPATPDGAELALMEMLDQLDGRDDASELEVLWPTALAYPVLRGALDQALLAVTAAPRGNRSLGELACLLATAQAVLRTLIAFVAVDLGGLEQVEL